MKRSTWRRWLPGTVMMLVATGAGGIAVVLIKDFLGTPAPQVKKVVQEVRLIRSPPPEPEPPPPEEVPQEQDVPLEEPMDAPDPGPADEAPPGDMLGLDAEGVAGGDGFGLMARRGGRDFLAGGGGSVYAWYAGRVKNLLLDELSADQSVRARKYSVLVRLWISGDGTIERVALDDSTGSPEIDDALRAALNSIGRLGDAPPPDMPQPIQIRIVSRS